MEHNETKGWARETLLIITKHLKYWGKRKGKIGVVGTAITQQHWELTIGQ